MERELFEKKESYNFDEIFKKSKEIIKKKYPERIEGETLEEYNQFLLDETRLEIAYRLRKVADSLEEKANERKQY